MDSCSWQMGQYTPMISMRTYGVLMSARVKALLGASPRAAASSSSARAGMVKAGRVSPTCGYWDADAPEAVTNSRKRNVA